MNEHLNMVVPIDLVKPILDDLRNSPRQSGRSGRGSGSTPTEIEDKVVIVGIAPKGPAARAELKSGDVVVAVNGARRRTWPPSTARSGSLGEAGVVVPPTLYREGVTFDVSVNSSDRAKS